MDINKTIEKLEEYNVYKRSIDPFNIEMNRLMNDVYPYEKLYRIFKLGQAQMLAMFKITYINIFATMIRIILMLLLNSQKKIQK